jgi:hypothetical protein
LIDLELPLLIQTNFINYSNNTEPGRDLEKGTTKTMAPALVRQRSRVLDSTIVCNHLNHGKPTTTI